MGKSLKCLLFLRCLRVKRIHTAKCLVSVPMNTRTDSDLSLEPFTCLRSAPPLHRLIPSVTGYIDWWVWLAIYSVVQKFGEIRHFTSFHFSPHGWMSSSSRRVGAQQMTLPLTLKSSFIIPVLLMVWNFSFINLSIVCCTGIYSLYVYSIILLKMNMDLGV